MSESLPIQCPSVGPWWTGSRLIGVVRQKAGGSLLAYLDEPVPVTDAILALAGEASPTRVFRFAGPCAGNRCSHFDGQDCRLVTRIVHSLPAGVDESPDCALRAACRWRRQEGEAACLRCPTLISESCDSEDLSGDLRLAADPATPV